MRNVKYSCNSTAKSRGRIEVVEEAKARGIRKEVDARGRVGSPLLLEPRKGLPLRNW